MSVNHYENFPVASILLPKHLHEPVKAIYAFARSADDIADEGDMAPQERLLLLGEYEKNLDWIEQNQQEKNGLFLQLEKVVHQFDLPLQPFRDLLSAFKQDVVTTRYPDFHTLLDYCRRSANPVGSLMLHLYGAVNEQNLRESDAICSALQLINFWQDVAIDWKKQRIYLPQDDMSRFQVSEDDIDKASVSDAWRGLMHFEIERARELMLSGMPLAYRLKGRIGWELRLVVHGGLRILDRIAATDYDVFRKRPTLDGFDWLYMILRSFFRKP